MADSQKADEVIVLGAGFSKAVSDTMPTVDELGEMAVARTGMEQMVRHLRDPNLRVPCAVFNMLLELREVGESRDIDPSCRA